MNVTPFEFEEVFVETWNESVHHLITEVIEIDIRQVLCQSWSAVTQDIAYDGDIGTFVSGCLDTVPSDLYHLLKGRIESGVHAQDQNRETLSGDCIERLLFLFESNLIRIDLFDIPLNGPF